MIHFVRHKFKCRYEFGQKVPVLVEQYWTQNDSWVQFRNMVFHIVRSNDDEFSEYSHAKTISICNQLREEYLGKSRLHEQLYLPYNQMVLAKINAKRNIHQLHFIAVNICTHDPYYRKYWFTCDMREYYCFAQYVSRGNIDDPANESNRNDYSAWFVGQSICTDIALTFLVHDSHPHTIDEMNTAYKEFWYNKFMRYKYVLLLSWNEISYALPSDVAVHIVRYYVQSVIECNAHELKNIAISK